MGNQDISRARDCLVRKILDRQCEIDPAWEIKDETTSNVVQSNNDHGATSHSKRTLRVV